MSDEIPNFTPDDELEPLLSEPVSDLDEDARIQVQRYKSRKLKAKRDAGMSGERPAWWAPDGVAPERADVVPGASDGQVRPSTGDSGSSPNAMETEETKEPEPDEPEGDGEQEPPEEAAEEDEEEEEVEVLPREELGEEPTEDELIRARLIEQPVEQDDSEGIFFTTIDRRKIYLAYGANAHYLTLYYYQVPSTVTDAEQVRWVKDLLARRAFEHAREEDLTVIPQRAEISENFLKRHPEFRDSVKRPNRRSTSAA